MRSLRRCRYLQTPHDIDGPVELDVSGCRLPVRDAAIGLHAFAFEQFSPPRVPGSCRDPDIVAVRDLVYAAADQPAGSLAPDYRRQLALLSEGGDPLAGAGGALIH